MKRTSGRLTCSVGVCVYNEAQNIGTLLTSLLGQRLGAVSIGEIIVITSGSTDKTASIVRTYAKKSAKIRLIKERVRRGKASAVNRYIAEASHDILVLMGGDLILTPRLIRHLVAPFASARVGMTGARPKPVNDIDGGLAGFAAHFLWELHHLVALETPKMGEVIAFRRVFRRIPIISSVDEANIEPLVRGQGYEIRYIPRAVVHNMAPQTVADYVRQRRRIYSGHLAVKHEQSYVVSTFGKRRIAKAILTYIRTNPRPDAIYKIPLVMLLEQYCRILGWWDYHIMKKRHTVWDVSHTTKNPAARAGFSR